MLLLRSANCRGCHRWLLLRSMLGLESRRSLITNCRCLLPEISTITIYQCGNHSVLQGFCGVAFDVPARKNTSQQIVANPGNCTQGPSKHPNLSETSTREALHLPGHSLAFSEGYAGYPLKLCKLHSPSLFIMLKPSKTAMRCRICPLPQEAKKNLELLRVSSQWSPRSASLSSLTKFGLFAASAPYSSSSVSPVLRSPYQISKQASMLAGTM